MKELFGRFFVVLLVFGVLAPQVLFAASIFHKKEAAVTIDFYHSVTCPHCRAENAFLDVLEDEYTRDELAINRYELSFRKNQQLVADQLRALGEERHIGVVPITIINNEQVLVGFDSADGMGMRIRTLIDAHLEGVSSTVDQEPSEHTILDGWDIEKYSLPVLAVLLGFLDGFNVCSLGALAFILSIVMVLGSRRRVLLYGGVFLVTTAVIYGLLIGFWHVLFSAFAPYLKVLETLIALLGIGGGVYFLREWRFMRKRGPVCEAGSNTFIMRATARLQERFQQPTGALMLVLAVLAFAAVVTIVEFPCSAAVPLAFAGILAGEGVVGFAAGLHIVLFILFYLLDELILFLVAVVAMRMWFASPKLTMYAVFAEGVILVLIGLYYLYALIL